jgi:thioredoxin-related protein
VDRLEARLTGHIRIFRIDISSDLGRHISDKYDAKTVPSFIVFDTYGTRIWKQYGIVPQAETILGLDL